MTDKNDYRTSMRVFRSSIDRLSEWGEEEFGTDQVPLDAILNRCIDKASDN